jgi:hypothetical protein
MWKVTTTIYNWMLMPLYADGLMKPTTSVRVYRWRWRARLAAFTANATPPMSLIIMRAVVEPYDMGANVIRMGEANAA